MAISKLQLATLLCYLLSFGAGNPLATQDQHELDTLAVALHNQKPYEDLKADATKAFEAGAQKFGYETDSQPIQDTLATAVEELAFSCMQKAVNQDPAHPRVYRLLAPPRTRATDGLKIPGGRYAFDNPDAVYRTIPISSNYSYVIRGQRTAGGPSDVTFTLQKDVTSQGTITILSNDDLDIQADGSFEITVNSSTSSSPNHIQSNSEAVQLFVRNNLGDWLAETPDSLEVELVEEKQLPDVFSNDTIIENARGHFVDSIPLFADFFFNMVFSNPVNEIQTPIQSQTLGTLVTQASSLAPYNLTKSEAIIVHQRCGQFKSPQFNSNRENDCSIQFKYNDQFD